MKHQFRAKLSDKSDEEEVILVQMRSSNQEWFTLLRMVAGDEFYLADDLTRQHILDQIAASLSG